MFSLHIGLQYHKPKYLVKVQRKETLAACPRQVTQKSHHQSDAVRGRAAFAKLVNEQERPWGAAAHHVGHLNNTIDILHCIVVYYHSSLRQSMKIKNELRVVSRATGATVYGSETTTNPVLGPPDSQHAQNQTENTAQKPGEKMGYYWSSVTYRSGVSETNLKTLMSFYKNKRQKAYQNQCRRHNIELPSKITALKVNIYSKPNNGRQGYVEVWDRRLLYTTHDRHGRHSA